MPGRDGTGPTGTGPVGRGKFCRPRRINDDSKELRETRPGLGFGNGSGLGRRNGMGRFNTKSNLGIRSQDVKG